MHVTRTIAVPVPASVSLDGVDLEVLTATFQALVALRCEKGHSFHDIAQELREEGWEVHWGLTWRAQAKRGDDYEEATGATLDEALVGVAQMALCDTAGRAP